MTSDPPESERARPVGGGEYVVRQGDCMDSIAWRLGVSANQIWEHGANAELREARADGVLLPGDKVTLPAPADRPSFAVSAGSTKRFRAQIPKMEVRLKLEHGSEPRADVPYTAVIDGVRHEGTTDGSGTVVLAVRPGSRRALLTVHERRDDYEFDDRMQLDLGGLDPASSSSGVQGRLRNLGYPVGPIDGVAGARTRAALRDYQRRNGLDETGEADEATIAHLRDSHGR
jgi:hypothetical protein